MAKSCKCIKDNVAMIRELTHENGSVNSIIFDDLIEDFDSYILFRKIYGDDMVLHPAIPYKTKIKFRVEFDSNKILKKFINRHDDTEINHRDQIYTPVFDVISEHIIDIYFSIK